jgi:hypothetical protein
MSYEYPAEKFSTAHQALVPPHARGDHVAVVTAFQECRLGLHRMNRSKLDQSARAWVYALECLMSTEGFSDAGGESAWDLKAKTFTAEQKSEIARLIGELAQWFATHSM